jgi:hypothetical protein
MLTTPEQISFFSLLSLRGALKIEVNTGLKHGRRSASAVAKDRFGLPKSWKKAEVLEFLDALVHLHKGEEQVWVSGPKVGKKLREYLYSSAVFREASEVEE